MTPKWCAVFALVLLCGGCSTTKPDAEKSGAFDKLTADFVFDSLALSPVSATQAGYHTHNGVALDEMLDDFSPAGIAAQRAAIAGFQTRIAALDQKTLDPEQSADLEIMKSNLALSLLELDSIQSYQHNPTVYVELAGSALFAPYQLNYAPVEKRFEQITKRLEKMPALFDQAKANLVDAHEVWNRVAQEENSGNIDLIDKDLRAAVLAPQKAAYDAAATKAIAALKDFNAFLKDTLSKKTSDWRLGKDKYARKFEYVLAVGKPPEQVLAEAEAELKNTRDEMAKLAAPKTVKQALDEIAKQHATPETYIAEANKDLDQAMAFVRDKGL